MRHQLDGSQFWSRGQGFEATLQVEGVLHSFNLGWEQLHRQAGVRRNGDIVWERVPVRVLQRGTVIRHPGAETPCDCSMGGTVEIEF